MAILTPEEQQELWYSMIKNTSEQHWTKQQLNTALQAVEDRLRSTGTQTTIQGDIEAAVPGVFNVQEKNLIFGSWCGSAKRRIGMV